VLQFEVSAVVECNNNSKDAKSYEKNNEKNEVITKRLK